MTGEETFLFPQNVFHQRRTYLLLPETSDNIFSRTSEESTQDLDIIFIR